MSITLNITKKGLPMSSGEHYMCLSEVSGELPEELKNLVG